MRISDWSSDVCSSDLNPRGAALDHLNRALERDDVAAEQLVGRMTSLPPEATLMEGAGRNVRRLGRTVETLPGRGSEAMERSEERRVGKECVSTCRSRL